MGETRFDPRGFYEFRLNDGAIQAGDTMRVVVLSDAVVGPLVAGAVQAGDLTAVRRFGRDPRARPSARIDKWWQEYTGNPLHALDRLLCRRFYMGILNRNETAEIFSPRNLPASTLPPTIFANTDKKYT